MFFMKSFGDKLKFALCAVHRLCDDYIIHGMSIFDLLNEKMQSMVIGVARRCGSGWEFKAVGEGTHHDKVNALAEHVARTTW